MSVMQPRANRVRERREARGLSQIALAERARLTRQSIGAIEAGRATPAVDVALRIARALDCQVEDLFGGPAKEPAIDAWAPSSVDTPRVALAHIGGRWISLPLAGDGLRLSGDGLLLKRRGKRALIEPVRPLAEARQNVVLMGCATGLGLLADRLNSRHGAGRFLWFPSSSDAALKALASGLTHVAGVHLAETPAGDACVAEVRRLASSEALTVVTLARWEAGLLTRSEDAGRIRGVADVADSRVRLVAREPSAGAQRLLERALRAAGVPVVVARQAPLVAAGHLDVARTIAMRAADVGVATCDAAMAFGLRFVPLAEERFDLVLPSALLADARLARLFDVLVSKAMRLELGALGYDVAKAGQRVAEVPAA
jgi:molybdate-binding protein/DNA-binding XRE family transcriptional regulator